MLSKREIHEAIESDQRKNVERLNNLFTRCKNHDLKNEFTHLASILEGQLAPSSEEAYAHDQKISQVISELERDIAQETYMMAASRIRTLNALLVQREQYCPSSVLSGTKADQKRARREEKTREKLEKRRKKDIEKRRKRGEPLASLYTPDEMVEFMVIQAAEKQQRAAAELQDLHDKLVKNPEDPIANALWDSKVIKYDSYNKAIDVLNLQAQRVALVQAAGMLTGEIKEDIAQALADGKIDDAKFAVIMDKFSSWAEQQVESGRVTIEGKGVFTDTSILAGAKAAAGTRATTQGTAGQQTGYTAGQQAGYTAGQRAMPGQQFGAGAASPAASRFANDPTFAKFGGLPDPKQQALQKAFETVDQLLARLNMEERRVNSEIDKLDAERQDVAEELLDLLRQRETATPAECIALDGQIDRLEKRHASLKRSIKRQNRLGAKLAEGRDMAENVKSLRDIQAVQEQLGEISSIFRDFEALAQQIAETDRQENAELDRMGEANMMANSEEITQGTMRSESITDQYSADSKDPQKYAALKQELTGEVAVGGRR